LCVLSLGCSCYVVSTSAIDSLERLVSEMIYNVLMGTLNPTHSRTQLFIRVHANIHTGYSFGTLTLTLTFTHITLGCEEYM